MIKNSSFFFTLFTRKTDQGVYELARDAKADELRWHRGQKKSPVILEYTTRNLFLTSSCLPLWLCSFVLEYITSVPSVSVWGCDGNVQRLGLEGSNLVLEASLLWVDQCGLMEIVARVRSDSWCKRRVLQGLTICPISACNHWYVYFLFPAVL